MTLISAGDTLVLSYMDTLHVSSTQSETLFPVPQEKNSIWSLHDSKATVFSPLERAFSCPHLSMMLSFRSRLSNWRVLRAF